MILNHTQLSQISHTVAKLQKSTDENSTPFCGPLKGFLGRFFALGKGTLCIGDATYARTPAIGPTRRVRTFFIGVAYPPHRRRTNRTVIIGIGPVFRIRSQLQVCNSGLTV